MQRQPEDLRSLFERREQQAVGAEIVQRQVVLANSLDQSSKTALVRHLAREDVVALHAGAVSGLSRNIYRPERQVAARGSSRPCCRTLAPHAHYLDPLQTHTIPSSGLGSSSNVSPEGPVSDWLSSSLPFSTSQ